MPDEVTEAMVRERLARPDTVRGVILDGFPRTLPQAVALNEMLTDLQRRLAGVLCIAVSDDAIVDILTALGVSLVAQAHPGQDEVAVANSMLRALHES